jgi:hypothetical protein
MAALLISAGNSAGARAAKTFFFEKKNQKTFGHLEAHRTRAVRSW